MPFFKTTTRIATKNTTKTALKNQSKSTTSSSTHKPASFSNKKSHKKFRPLKLLFLLVILLAAMVLFFPSAFDEFKRSHVAQLTPQSQSQPPSTTASLASASQNHDSLFETATTPLSAASIDKVYVDKCTQKLYLLQDGKAVKRYHIALGDVPKGHKQQEGDERTPEGIYTLDYKNENSIAYRSIHVSYPNATDIAKAEALGVSPGGDIMIHGQMNGYGRLAPLTQQRNWTDGCMAVTNEEMDEIMSAVKVGTPIEIVW